MVLGAVISGEGLRMGFGATVAGGTSTRVVESILAKDCGFLALCVICVIVKGEGGLVYFFSHILIP